MRGAPTSAASAGPPTSARGWGLLSAAASLLLAALPACATTHYAAGLEGARADVVRGDPSRAVRRLDASLAATPPGAAGRPLLLAERGAALLRAGRLAEAGADLARADSGLEVLDLTDDTRGALATKLFSGAAARYHAPPFEKLGLNVLGMAARAASGDLSGALVEARRLHVLDRFFTAADADPGAIRALGRALAAVSFDLAGDRAEAARFAAEAGPEAARPALAPGEGELVVLAAWGLAPRRAVRWTPLKEAAAAAGLPVPAAPKGAAPRVGILVIEGDSPAPASLRLDGASAPWTVQADLAATARRTFAAARPALARAAVQRARLRTAGGAAVERAAGKGRTLLGAILGTATVAAAGAGDVPDTRSWTLLPGRLGLLRRAVAAGHHRVCLAPSEGEDDGAGGEVAAPSCVDVEVRPGRTVFVTLFER